MIIDTDTLENWIDTDGAWNVMLAMELILSERGEIMRHKWDDKKAARVYFTAARQARKLMREFEKADI